MFFIDEDDVTWHSGKIVFKKYELISLKKVGFAEVWEARDTDGMIYAIKRPNAKVLSNLSNKMIVKGFEKEFFTHIKLPKHPNVANVHNIGILNSKIGVQFPCLIMDYSNIPLKDWIEKTKAMSLILKINSILLIMIELINALYFLHKNGALDHSDIKKENILLSTEDISINNFRNGIIFDFNLSSTQIKEENSNLKTNFILSIIDIFIEISGGKICDNIKSTNINLLQIFNRYCEILPNYCFDEISSIAKFFFDQGNHSELADSIFNDIKNKFINLFNKLNSQNPYDKNKETKFDNCIGDIVNKMAAISFMYSSEGKKEPLDKKMVETIKGQYHILLEHLYEQGCSIEKDNPFLTYNKLLFDYKKGVSQNFESFVENFKNAISKGPSILGNLLLARLNIYLHKLNESNEILKKIDERTDLYYNLDEFEKAEYYYNSKGIISLGLGEYDLSIKAFLDAYETSNDNSKKIEYLINSCIPLLKKGESEKAAGILKMILYTSKDKEYFYNYVKIRFGNDHITLINKYEDISKKIEIIIEVLTSVFIPNGYYITNFVILPNYTEKITNITTSPNHLKRNIALVGTDKGKMVLLNIKNGKSFLNEEIHEGNMIIACSFSKDVEKAISVDNKGIINIWKVKEKTIESENSVLTNREIKDISFYGDDDDIIIGIINQDAVKKYSINNVIKKNFDGKEIFKTIDKKYIHNVSFSGNNQINYALLYTKPGIWPRRGRLTHCQNSFFKDIQNKDFYLPENIDINDDIKYMKINSNGEYSAFTLFNHKKTLILNICKSKKQIILEDSFVINTFCFSNNGKFLIALFNDTKNNVNNNQMLDLFKIKIWDLNGITNDIPLKTINVKSLVNEILDLSLDINNICCCSDDRYLLLGTTQGIILRIDISSINSRNESQLNISTVFSQKVSSFLLDDINYLFSRKKIVDENSKDRKKIESIFKESSNLERDHNYKEACEKLSLIIKVYPEMKKDFLQAKSEIKRIRDSHGTRKKLIGILHLEKINKFKSNLKIMFDSNDDIVIFGSEKHIEPDIAKNLSTIYKYKYVEKYEFKTKSKYDIFTDESISNSVIKEFIISSNHGEKYVLSCMKKTNDCTYKIMEIEYNNKLKKYNFRKVKNLGSFTLDNGKTITSFIVINDFFILLSTKEGVIYFYNTISKSLSLISEYGLELIIRDISCDEMNLLIQHNDEMFIGYLEWEWEWN